MPPRLRPGAVLEFAVGDGLGYVLFAGRHPAYGDAVVPATRVFPARRSPTAAEFEGSYFTFYLAQAAARAGLVSIVVSLPPPQMPTTWRRPGMIRGRTVETWLIDDDVGTRVVSQLRDSERQIPIASIWNHAMLAARVPEGWRPEHWA